LILAKKYFQSEDIEKIEEILEMLFDDNPIKHNLYRPGQHIPVVPSEEICNTKPAI